MDYLYNIFLLLLFSTSTASLTYTLSQVNVSTIGTYLQLTMSSVLTNTASVRRLSTSDMDLLTSTQILLSATNVESIGFAWNSGDCSYPAAIAKKNSSIYISSPICFTAATSSSSSLTNLIQLTATIEQLAQAGIYFLNMNSLHYFSMVVSDSNDFYTNLASQFASYLTSQSYIYERTIPMSNFTTSAINSLKTRG